MVYVYLADVTHLPDPKEAPEIMKGLPEERKQKILRYRQVADRKRSLGAGLLLKKVLARHNHRIDSVTYGVNGKPEISGIHFNLSHSHNKVVCAVSDKLVGCDIEKIEEVTEKIAERFFAKSEIAYLNSFKYQEKMREFFRIWTMKESYMKMTGEGMSLGLHNFEIVFGNEVEICREGKRCSCNIREYEIPGYKLTVCAEETEFAEIVNVCI